jgi:hypothetical protein
MNLIFVQFGFRTYHIFCNCFLLSTVLNKISSKNNQERSHIQFFRSLLTILPQYFLLIFLNVRLLETYSNDFLVNPSKVVFEKTKKLYIFYLEMEVKNLTLTVLAYFFLLNNFHIVLFFEFFLVRVFRLIYQDLAVPK